MTAPTPREGRCHRCKQTRPLFNYKADHDCIDAVGRVDLVEAARLIEELEDHDDRWCLARVNSLPIRLCVPCTDREHADEAAHAKEYQL
ncbi:hypothetical protein [Streptomyces sp. NPDC001054]